MPASSRPHRLDIVAIGASAAGLEAITALLRQLPPNLNATIMVVLHRSPDYASYLPQILAREGRLHVKVPDEGEPLRPGVCLVGLPNKHLTVGPDLRVHFLQDHFYRGHNINVLFQSLAQHAGKRTIGVVLSGLLKDGTLGLKAIKEAGGVALVQSPEQAVYSEMPRNAIHHDGAIDFVGSLHALANEIRRLVDDVPAERPVSESR